MHLLEPSPFLILWQFVVFVYLILLIWTLILLFREKETAQSNTSLWLLVIIFVPFGAIFYLRNRKR